MGRGRVCLMGVGSGGQGWAGDVPWTGHVAGEQGPVMPREQFTDIGVTISIISIITNIRVVTNVNPSQPSAHKLARLAAASCRHHSLDKAAASPTPAT